MKKDPTTEECVVLTTERARRPHELVHDQHKAEPPAFLPSCPFCPGNEAKTPQQIEERLNHYHIPTDLPLLVEISRFDRWKDPGGVIEAFKLARKEVGCTLVLLGIRTTRSGKDGYRNLRQWVRFEYRNRQMLIRHAQ